MTTKLRHQVREFMDKHGQLIRTSPEAAPDEVLRLRARLILEEAFEYAEASFGEPNAGQLAEIKELVLQLIQMRVVMHPDLPKMADALADIDYVVEGARLTLGIDGDPIADEVHRTNMNKPIGGKDNLKVAKPADWKAPDITTKLQEQGWQCPNP